MVGIDQNNGVLAREDGPLACNEVPVGRSARLAGLDGMVAAPSMPGLWSFPGLVRRALRGVAIPLILMESSSC